MTILWPIEVLRPRLVAFDIAPRSLSGPASVSGKSQVTASDAGIWKATLGDILIRTKQDRIAFRALSALLEGRLNPIVVPLCRGDQPVPDGAVEGGLYGSIPHSDGAFFSDGSGYVGTVIDVVAAASAAARAVSLKVTVTYAGEIQSGQHFSIGERLYRVQRFAETPPYQPEGTSSAEGNFISGAYDAAAVSVSRASTATYFGADGLLKTAAANEARFDHDPVTKARKGLLVEGAGTNLAIRSQEFQTSWSKVRAVFTANVTTAPDGTLTAGKLRLDTTLSPSTHYLGQSVSFVAGQRYTFSIFAKAAELSWIALDLPSAAFGATCRASFNLAAGARGTISANADGNMQACADGWYRCSISAVATADDSGSAIAYLGEGDNDVSWANPDGISGFFVWGAQVEVGGPLPTSYIPTAAATVTRAADAAIIAAQNKSDWTLTLDSGVKVPFAGVSGSLSFDRTKISRDYVASYEAKLAVPVPGTGTITFRPPLREAVSAGDRLEFDNPIVRMRLASDQEMDLELQMRRFGSPTVQLIEDV